MPFNPTAARPVTEAIESLDRREPFATALDTEGLSDLPLSVRRRSFFSAKVESARLLELMKRSLQKNVNQFGINRDRASFVKAMQDAATDLGIEPPETGAGTLLDITSGRRLRLIFDIQTGLAKGEAAYRIAMDPALLNAAPAQELIRVEDRDDPRDWPARWSAAGGEFSEGSRMIALKTDPIWQDISRFDLPWPPFDFNSGMGVRNVRRREAIDLGLLSKRERLEPIDVDDLAARPAASYQSLPDQAVDAIDEHFGETVSRDPIAEIFTLEETALSDFAERVVSGDLPEETSFDLGRPDSLGGARLEITGKAIKRLLGIEGNGIESPADFDNLPAVLWTPDRTREAEPFEGFRLTLFDTFLKDAIWNLIVEQINSNAFSVLSFGQFDPFRIGIVLLRTLRDVLVERYGDTATGRLLATSAIFQF